MTDQLPVVKPKTAIEKHTHTTVDTIMVTSDLIGQWKLPSGQRPLRENQKVRDIAEKIKTDGGVIPGILTLGILAGNKWVIDGQHRLHSFKLSGVKEGYADVRFFHAGTMSEINREFVELNSKLVAMRPDDFLRGLEESIPALAQIREACTYVGYDQIRRGTSGPIVSMSVTLRSWNGSQAETPVAYSGGFSSVQLAESLTEDEAKNLIGFLDLANSAFGHDLQYSRLWSVLNVTLCMWLYRRLVLGQHVTPASRIIKISKDQFKKCLMSVSADAWYQDWLLGRHMGERDRSPAYSRLKNIFVKRLNAELGQQPKLPRPDWCNG